MNFRIESAKANDISTIDENRKKKSKSGNYTVKAGDTVYGLMKAFNFKNEKEFRDYVKMSGTAKLQKGAVLRLPTVKFETTFAAVARKYNMSIRDLAKLNPQIKDINKISKGTLINVPYRPFEKQEEPQAEHVPPENTPRPETSAQKPEIEMLPARRYVAPPEVTVPDYTAAEIAKELKKSASDFGDIQRKIFKTAFANLNKVNFFLFFNEYVKISPK